MKKKFFQALAAAACAGLVITGACAVAYAAQGEAPAGPDAPAAQAAGEDAGAQLLSRVEKDEMVYVFTDAAGSVERIIVSDWIKNTLGSASVTDASELAAPEAVRGTQHYTADGGGALVWDAQGEDVYYQGQIEKELPVTLSVSYWLNGKSISPAELAGKSGKVTIRFDYTNRQYEMVTIDGKEEKIYVPFAMMTGVLLDNDRFTNVQVSNGKLVNDGSRTAVIGIAFPGLQSNLKADAEKFEIPGYVEITADVQDFELGNTVTIATKEPFDELKTEDLDSVDALGDSLDTLSDAMGQLLDGSSQLYDGLCTLLERSGELTAGVSRLADGAARLRDGTAAVHDGAAALAGGAAELSGGANTLADGLNTLDGSSAALNDGARQVFDTLLAAATTQLNAQLSAMGQSVPPLTAENYSQILNGLLQQLDPDAAYSQAQGMAQDQAAASVNARKAEIEAAVTQAVRAQVADGVTAAVRGEITAQTDAALRGTYGSAVEAGTMTQEELEAAIGTEIENQMASAEIQAAIAAKIEEQMQSPEIQATIAANTQQQIADLIASSMGSADVQGQIDSAVGAAQAGAAQIAALKAQLDGYNAFYTGLAQYTAGVAQARAGADSLNTGAARLQAGADSLGAGTAQLQSGAAELCGGVDTLKGSLPALTDGVTALRDGAMQLSGGLEEFNEKGVQRLVDAAEGGLEGLAGRIRATSEVSRGWRSFAGISEEMDGQVRFLYRTGAIEQKAQQ